MFVEFLPQVIERKSREESFKAISEKYLRAFSEERLVEDVGHWDAQSYDFFLAWMRNGMEWWRDLGIYEGWLRFVPKFAGIAEDVQQSLSTDDPEECLACLRNAWKKNKQFLPVTLLYSDELAKAGDAVKAIALLEKSGTFFPVLQRRMVLSAAHGKKKESILLAQELYNRADAPIFNDQRYRQRATQHIMRSYQQNPVDSEWLMKVWEGLREFDLRAHPHWVSWVYAAVEPSKAASGNAMMTTRMRERSELSVVEANLRDLCDGVVDFMESDGSRSATNTRPPAESTQQRDPIPAPKPPEALRADSSAHVRGVLTWYTPEKSFGFVCAEEDGQRLFVHGSNFAEDSVTPIPGMNLRFTPQDTALGLEAMDVYVITD